MQKNKRHIAYALGIAGLLLLPTGCKGGYSYDDPPTAAPSAIATVPGGVSTSCLPSTSAQSVLRRKLSSVPAGAVTAVPTTTYTLTSFPAGATVTNGTTALGTAPVSFAPSYADASNIIVFTLGADTYSICLTQAGFASRNILFNASGDTTGSITTVSSTTSSFARRALSAKAGSTIPASIPRHAVRHALNHGVSNSLLLVKYRSSVLQSTHRSVQSVETSVGIATAHNLGPQNEDLVSRVVHIPATTNSTSLTSKLLSDPAVAGVYPVHYRSTLSITPFTPNDPDFTVDTLHQWDMYQIQAPDAWAISQGSSSVAIAIIDTGYDSTNTDLAGKVTNAESDINGVTTSGTAAALDTDGHGTNVSGIAAADTNNNVSVAGTGFNVSLQEYRIFPNPGETNYSSTDNQAATPDEAQAIYDAVSNGANVISLSIGAVESSGIDQSEYDAIEYALSKNVSVVCAAGNDYSSTDTSIDFPAALPGVIAVGATTLNDTTNPNVPSTATEQVASYSNSGPGLALVAPGGDPSSTSDPDYLHWIFNLDTSQSAAGNVCSTPPSCVALLAGTSQATPHVSGAIALIYSVNSLLTPAQVKSLLMSNADNINDPRQGAGRLNVYRALAAASGVAAVPAPTAPAYPNFVAFGYTNSGGTTPTIIDVTYPNGVPVNADGTFRLPDINSSSTSYKIGVWADVNGDGMIDAGDYFGVASGTCSVDTPCTTNATGITVAPVASGFTLP